MKDSGIQGTMKSTKIFKIYDKFLKLFNTFKKNCLFLSYLWTNLTPPHKVLMKTLQGQFIDRKLSKFLQINVDSQYIFNINSYDDL